MIKFVGDVSSKAFGPDGVETRLLFSVKDTSSSLVVAVLEHEGSVFYYIYPNPDFKDFISDYPAISAGILKGESVKDLLGHGDVPGLVECFSEILTSDSYVLDWIEDERLKQAN